MALLQRSEATLPVPAQGLSEVAATRLRRTPCEQPTAALQAQRPR